MRLIIFDVGLFGSESDLAYSELFLESLLLALTAGNVAYLRSHPNTPRLYRSGVVYRREPRGRVWHLPSHGIVFWQEPKVEEIWKNIPSLYRDGYGDCEDLACALAAERTVKDGIPSRPVFRKRTFTRNDGKTFRLYHIRTLRSDGVIEDPSRVLGMGAEDG